MEYALFTNNNKIVEVKNIDNYNQNEKKILQNEGWKEVIQTEKPLIDETIEYLHSYIKIEEDETYKRIYVIIKDKEKIFNKISFLKQQLSESDYKVIKNMEAQLVNEELPYDSVTLHAERQALRDKINELEELLKNN